MMGERVKTTDYSTGNCSGAGVEDRVSEWEVGLPNIDDLTPLSQALIPPQLASAFRISPEPSRSMLDVIWASQNAMSSLLAAGKGGGGSQGSNKFKLFHDDTYGTMMTGTLDGAVMDIDEADLTGEGSESLKIRRVTIGGGSAEETDSETNNKKNNSNENGGDEDDSSTKTLKRARLVWTPQLHKRFIEVVAHLGIKNAVPKSIMQLMNVEGLSRENVASHLQKYRLYVKRMQGVGPSSSSCDQLLGSTPVPHSLHESGSGNENENENENEKGMSNGYMGMPFPMPYPIPPPPATQMVPMPVIQMQQQMDWPVPHHYYHVAPNDK